MSQQKAASLTSSLFARKGKASPASLLISELEAGGAEGPAAVHGKVNSRAGANGSRRKPKPVEDLPLLALVVTQSDAAAEAAQAAVTLDEPPPAASLLDRGARSWRRANDQSANGHLANGKNVKGPEPAPATVEEIPVAAEARSSGDSDDAVPATISGDANVAAIEDAPQDEPPHALQDAAAVTGAEEDAADAAIDKPAEAAEEQPAEAAGEAPAPEITAAATELPAPVAEQPTQAAMPATLALRQAAALRVPPAPPAEMAPPPAAAVSRSPALWRSAAVVALGAALGFGLYLAVAGEDAARDDAPATAALPAVAPTVAALPAEVAGPAEPAATVPPAAEALAPSEASPAPVEAAAPSAEAALPEPSFDIIRIEPDGQSIIAGRAAPGSEWILLNNGSPIAAVRADANGEWVVLPDSALTPGANAFSLVPKAERGAVTIPAPESAAQPAAAPQPAVERGEAAGPEAAAPVEQPRAEAPPPALPKAKPAVPATVAEDFRAVPEGAYEVQLASVRDSADANRERLRLTGAFPTLLGAMDLRVQQASLEEAGVFYRVRSGAIDDLGLARELCRRLESAGQGCLVVRRPEAPAATVAEDLPDAAAAVRQQAAERPR